MLRSLSHGTPSFKVIYFISVIFNYHVLLVTFINSTYLERFISATTVSMLFSFSAITSVFLFIYFPKIITRFGNFLTLLLFGALEVIMLYILALTHNPLVAVLSFFIFLTINPLLYLCLDVFAETIIGNDETKTGSRRGLLLALISLASAIAPFTVAFLIAEEDGRLYQIYLLAAGVGIIFLLLTSFFFRNFKDPYYEHQNIIQNSEKIITSKIFLPVFVSHFLLQVFFAWTTVYFPLYLITEMNFSWGEVGTIVGIAIMAYVIFEYPLGIIEDRWWGEKEIMMIGFVIIVTSCFFMSQATTLGVFGWAALLFYGRTGAAGVETATEIYFFKHITGKDASLISLFRILRPLGLSAGTLLGTISLIFLPFQYIFIVLGLFLCLGFISTLALIDTK